MNCSICKHELTTQEVAAYGSRCEDCWSFPDPNGAPHSAVRLPTTAAKEGRHNQPRATGPIARSDDTRGIRAYGAASCYSADPLGDTASVSAQGARSRRKRN